MLTMRAMVCSPVREKKSSDCSKEVIEKANTCAEKLWFAGRHSRRFPESSEQLTKHCKETTELIKCVKDVTDRCGNEMHRHLANAMLFTMKSTEKTYCSKAVKQKEFLSLGVCGNHIRDQSSKCMDRFLLSLGKANRYDNRYKIPYSCWYVIRMTMINLNMTLTMIIFYIAVRSMS